MTGKSPFLSGVKDALRWSLALLIFTIGLGIAAVITYWSPGPDWLWYGSGLPIGLIFAVGVGTLFIGSARRVT